MILHEHRPSEASFPIYGLLKMKENARCPRSASAQDIARLNSNCLIRWKIPGVVRIISSRLCLLVASPGRH